MVSNQLTIQSTEILLKAPKVIVVKGSLLDGEMKDHSTDRCHTIGKLHLVIRYLAATLIRIRIDGTWCNFTGAPSSASALAVKPHTWTKKELDPLSERAQHLSQKRIDQIKAHNCKTPPAVLLLLGIPAQDTCLQNFVNDISRAVTRKHGTIISIGTGNEQTINRATRSRPAKYSLSLHPENWATAIMECIAPPSTTEDQKRLRASSPAPPPRKRPATSSGKQNASSAAAPTLMIDTTGEGLATGPSGSNNIVTPALGQKRADVPDALTSRRTNRKTPSLVRVHEASKSMSGALNASPVKNEVDQRWGPANFGLGAGFKRTSGYNTMVNTAGGTPQVKLKVNAPGCDIPQVKPDTSQVKLEDDAPGCDIPQVKLEVDAPGNLGGLGSNNRIQGTVRNMISLYEGRGPFCRKHCRPVNECCN
ncbi:hypothetical protein FN846DRAFT_911887 [Sphaerosporella brunnea]|uniref:Uncharacterized protein n=1 Tax=Sphaerosporella brunnea TaxID=1250544 RepID=A0A5J5EJR6_9PEZI|nr:hypothetical protein FN846DRAFT_911887 [Sphaerosporella brunnea]